MAYKKKKNREKGSPQKGENWRLCIFWWTERSPRTEDSGKSGFGYKTTWKCPFLLPTKLGGGVCVCVSPWGRHRGYKETIAAHGARPSYFPLLKNSTTIYHFDLAACPLGPVPSLLLSQCLEAADGLLCLLRTQGISGEAFGCPTCL